MIYLNLILISIICVCIIDLSGFIDSIKYGMSHLITKGVLTTTNYRIKPFDCSLCMTHWLGLIYLIVAGKLSILTYTVLLLIAVSTPIIQDFIRLIQDLLTTIINKINNRL